MDRSNSYNQGTGRQRLGYVPMAIFRAGGRNPTSALGHTTLILQKRAGVWLIVLNHTSGILQRSRLQRQRRKITA